MKELHERMQATVDDLAKIRDEACAVPDELSARRQDVLIQLKSLRERVDQVGGLDAPPKPRTLD